MTAQSPETGGFCENATSSESSVVSVEQDLRGEPAEDRFRNQFLLGERFIDSLSGWQRLVLGNGLKLSVHPQLAVESVADGDRSITIVGHMFDYRCPERDNAAIARWLLTNCPALDELAAATSVFGGRWVVIAGYGGRWTLFNDALGLRQVCYTTLESGHGLWVASQPGLLAWLLDLTIDDAAERFLDSFEVRTHSEYRWPASATAFRETIHLLPNHCLDLTAHRCRRYWPDGPLREISLEEAIKRTAGILKGLMSAIHGRFQFTLGMTAGLDSRIVLAACREIQGAVTGITVRQSRMPDDHQDLVVAARVLASVDIPHEVVRVFPAMSADFSRAFKRNVFLAHDHYGPDAEAILNRFGRERVAVTGSGAEVVRQPFRTRIDADKARFTADDLAGLQRMGTNRFALDAFGQWLDGVGERFNVHLLDLFAWEQSHGNWLAATQLEFDIAWRDIFTPFNCRELLVAMLSVDGCHRSAPDHRAFRLLIESMWPQLLDEPINPDNNKHGVSFLRKARDRAKRVISKRWFGGIRQRGVGGT